MQDQFVWGLRSEAVQKKLLAKDEFTFQEAIRIAQASEQAVAKARQLQSHGTAAQRDSTGALSVGRLSAPQSGSGTNSCYRCGKSDHTPAACRFKAARCHNCNKIGHIAAVCRKKRQGSPKPTQGRGRQPPGLRGIKSVREGEEAQPTEQLGLKTIRCEQGKPLVMDLQWTTSHNGTGYRGCSFPRVREGVAEAVD